MDCDDTNASVNPDANEVCDGLDNDCDGSLLPEEIDHDDDGYVECVVGEWSDPSVGGGDCDDMDPSTHPGATEVCDGLDNDCDGEVDEGDVCGTTWYRDADGDTWGDADDTIVAVEQPAGYVAGAGDCDDIDPGIDPGAVEVCDGLDNDCDGEIDEGCGLISYWPDVDEDGYGDAFQDAVVTDEGPPPGYVTNNGDCNDGDPATNPEAVEVCDHIDNDCDGEVDEGACLFPTAYYRDADGDTYGDSGRHG